jgi:hypothetical protein
MAAARPGVVIPEKYAQALGGDDPVDVMAESPGRLKSLVRGLTERQLSKKPAPGKWSIKEIVAHLADGEIILGTRYRLIAAQDRPPIAGYDQDAFVARLGVGRVKTADLIDDFAMARAVNLGLLDRLAEPDWDRVGIHAERGEESIRKMVFMYAGHDRHHIRQIETIRTGLFPRAGKRKAKAKPTRRPTGKR